MGEKEEFDKLKTKVLKYIIYKKRTKKEVIRKFEREIEKEKLEEVIEELEELDYINDERYIEKQINEYIALKNMSIKEMKYKLLAKGLEQKLIENYFDKTEEQLLEYEQKSAKNIMRKKCKERL